MSNFWGHFFSCFQGQFFFFNFFEIKLVFLGPRRFSNVNVLHKGLLLQDWVFRLGAWPNLSKRCSQVIINLEKKSFSIAYTIFLYEWSLDIVNEKVIKLWVLIWRTFSILHRTLLSWCSAFSTFFRCVPSFNFKVRFLLGEII